MKHNTTHNSNYSDDARRVLKSGGVYLNHERLVQMDKRITRADLLDERLLLLRTGKSQYRLIDFG